MKKLENKDQVYQVSRISASGFLKLYEQWQAPIFEWNTPALPIGQFKQTSAILSS